MTDEEESFKCLGVKCKIFHRNCEAHPIHFHDVKYEVTRVIAINLKTVFSTKTRAPALEISCEAKQAKNHHNGILEVACMRFMIWIASRTCSMDEHVTITVSA